MRPSPLLAAAASLMLLAPVVARASTTYQIQPILKLGDPIGDTGSRADFGFEIDGLTDNGQLLFVTYTTSSEIFFQYADGKFTPIMRPGEPSPSGKWPTGDIWSPVSMNQSGNAVFSMFGYTQGRWLGTFLWDAKARQVTSVALAQMPAANGLTFAQAGGARPAINNSGDIAFPAEVKDASGKVLGYGLFFRGRDGQLRPIALPGQAGPDGAPIVPVSFNPVSISDSGRVAFLALRGGQSRVSAYVWENGTITPVALVGTEAPGGGKIVDLVGAWVNSKTNSVLVQVVLDRVNTGHQALYLWSDGRLTPVAVPGQPMPDGGTFLTAEGLSVGFANDLGQHAFFGRVSEGGISRSAAYLMEPDGKLSLILKSGATTSLGQVVRVGDADSFGVGLNNKGQVALGIRFTGARSMIAVLTPTTP